MAENGNSVSALLPYMTADNCIGSGSRGSVWLIRRADTDRTAAIKRISIPSNQQNVRALLFSGAVANEEEALAYYKKTAEEILRELDLLSGLKDSAYILPFRGSFLTQKEGEVGYDLYLLSDYSETLKAYLDCHAITRLESMNLALDLCSALEDYRKAGLIHRDIRPENVYRTVSGKYLLGDLGAVPIDELEWSFIPEEQFNCWSAPETADGASGLNRTIDIYSIGMILYRIYNGGHAPLEDEKTGSKTAEGRRVAGEALPAPMYADYELAEIICRACAPEPGERYQTPEELSEELRLYMQRNRMNEEPVVQPFAQTNNSEEDARSVGDITEKADVIFDGSNDAGSDDHTHGSDSAVISAESEPNHTDSPLYGTESKETSSRKIWLPVTVSLVLIVAFMGCFLYLTMNPFQANKENAANTEAVSSQSDQNISDAAKESDTTDHTEDIAQTAQVQSMTALVVGIDTIQISVDGENLPSDLQVVCSDSFGNIQRQDYNSAGNIFTSLEKGTDYLFTLESGEKIDGVLCVNAITDNTTRLEGFSISNLSDSQAQIDFEYSGICPTQWRLELYDMNGLVQSADFEGTAVLLKGLEPGTEYTVKISSAEGLELLGDNECSFVTERSVTLKSFMQTEVGKDYAVLSWHASGSLPDTWEITCRDAAGNETTQIVDGAQEDRVSYKWEGLSGGEEYSFFLSCDGLKDTEVNNLSFRLPILSVNNLNVEYNEENGTVEVEWNCVEGYAQDGWNVSFSTLINGTTYTETVVTSETSAELSGLIPNTDYQISLETIDGTIPQGTSSCSFTTPVSERYTENQTSLIAMVMWEKPDVTPFDAGDLQTFKSRYTQTEGIAFAMQGTSGNSDDAIINVLYLVRSSDGSVVSVQNNGELRWGDIWKNNVYVGSLEQTPQYPGGYTIEVYFDSKLYSSADFIILES